MFIGLLVALYFLHSWLAANSATVSDQAIVYLTVVLVFVSYLQWDVMLEQNAVIERQMDQAESQQRAWIAVSAGEIKTFEIAAEQGGLVIDWHVVARNTGATPGIITNSHIEHKLRGVQDKKPVLGDASFWMRYTQPRRTVIAPSAELRFALTQGLGWISNSDVEDLRAGAKEAYILSAFMYRDVFGGEHITACIFRYDKTTGQLTNNHDDGEMT